MTNALNITSWFEIIYMYSHSLLIYRSYRSITIIYARGDNELGFQCHRSIFQTYKNLTFSLSTTIKYKIYIVPNKRVLFCFWQQHKKGQSNIFMISFVRPIARDSVNILLGYKIRDCWIVFLLFLGCFEHFFWIFS